MIADGKRGDIARQRARLRAGAASAASPTPFGPSAGLGADAVTQNPLLGRDALAPFVDAAARRRRRRLRARAHVEPGRRRPVRRRAGRRRAAVGAARARWSRTPARPGPESGLADVGAVTGATAPAAPRADARADAARPVPAARHRRPGRRRSPTSRRPSRPAAPAGSSAPRARSRTRTRRPAARPPTPRAPRPSGCASRPGRSPERRAGIRPGPAGYHRSTWPDAAPRASSRRSRWWPSRWPCSSSSSSTTKDDGGTPGARDAPRRGARRRRRTAPSASRRSATPRTYTVKAGDTPSGIAEKVDVPLETDPRAQPRPRPADADAGHEDQAAMTRALAPPARAPCCRAPGAAALAAGVAAPPRARRTAARAERAVGDPDRGRHRRGALRARGREAPRDRLDDEADDRAAHDGDAKLSDEVTAVELRRARRSSRSWACARASGCRSPTCCAA